MEQRSAHTTEDEQRGAREAGQVRAAHRPQGRGGKPRLPAPARTAATRTAATRGAYGPGPQGAAAPDGPAGRGPGDGAYGRARARGPNGPPRAGSSALSRMPAPRLTGLGTGVFAALLMSVAGGLEGLLFDSAPAFYGTLFVLVCIASALWVRPRELFAAPVAAPLAYTIGQFCAGGPGSGVSGVLQDVFTSLALHAVWLYAGTLTAVSVVLVRKAVLSVLRRNAKKAGAASRKP